MEAMLNFMSADKLRAELLALPVEERAELAHALLASLHQDGDAGADAAWLKELDRRAEAVADGTAKLIDWQEARERIATRLKARRATPPSR
jgi:putative addiction module component (TIGR02574 family)